MVVCAKIIFLLVSKACLLGLQQYPARTTREGATSRGTGSFGSPQSFCVQEEADQDVPAPESRGRVGPAARASFRKAGSRRFFPTWMLHTFFEKKYVCIELYHAYDKILKTHGKRTYKRIANAV